MVALVRFGSGRLPEASTRKVAPPGVRTVSRTASNPDVWPSRRRIASKSICMSASWSRPYGVTRAMTPSIRAPWYSSGLRTLIEKRSPSRDVRVLSEVSSTATIRMPSGTANGRAGGRGRVGGFRRVDIPPRLVGDPPVVASNAYGLPEIVTVKPPRDEQPVTVVLRVEGHEEIGIAVAAGRNRQPVADELGARAHGS